MRVMQVIHGYPMRFNAGSEVYTQALAQALADRHEVRVFTRSQDPFRPDYELTRERDPDDKRVRLDVVNLPRSRDRYVHCGVDDAFRGVVRDFSPDVVHFGHLNHLSMSLVEVAKQEQRPVLFTLHDYWLMCPRGQFMQMHPSNPADLWAACDGQDDRKCALRCYARYFGGDPGEMRIDLEHWTRWVGRRMAHARRVAGQVDLFIAPSRYLRDRFVADFGIPASRIAYLDYGFPLERLEGRCRESDPEFVFGYIGTHTPAKGIQHLLEAFGGVRGKARLRIWGRARGENTASLESLSGSHSNCNRVEWLPEYRNPEIVSQVFNRVDAIVVPSIWAENSPLVIHEALQAGVAVVTADAGGMAEHVRDGVNGLLFPYRDPGGLRAALQRLVDDPESAARLGRGGFLHSKDGSVLSMRAHAREVERMYEQLVQPATTDRRPGPWRITFDTNPDDCNLHCVMCEEHSPHSELQARRRAEGRPKRRMPIDLVRRVLDSAGGTPLREIIPSTMGEPLLYEHFDKILDLCARHRVMLNLTTNGTFPGRGATAWARRIVPVTSDVKISWNGARKETAERIMLGTRWEQLLDNVRRFRAVRDEHADSGGNRCRMTFQLTFLETNVHELAEIVRLAATLGVDRVKGHHLWTHFPEIEDLSMRRNPAAIDRWNAAARDARQAADATGVLVENIDVLGNGAVSDLDPDATCPFLGREAWISAEGRFSPCCAPDAARRSLGDFGTLQERSLAEIWSSDEYRALQRGYMEHDLCYGCNMRRREEQT